jgi:superfamily II DNA/RNA helicase
LVFNYDLPDDLDNVARKYTGRVGRTGRVEAGAEGEAGKAISFVTVEDCKLAPALISLLKSASIAIPRELVAIEKEYAEQ